MGKGAGAGSQRAVRGASDREKGLSEGLFVGKGAGTGSQRAVRGASDRQKGLSEGLSTGKRCWSRQSEGGCKR